MILFLIICGADNRAREVLMIERDAIKAGDSAILLCCGDDNTALIIDPK
nr:hypothetical protein [Thaumasiovibrio occultus]